MLKWSVGFDVGDERRCSASLIVDHCGTLDSTVTDVSHPFLYLLAPTASGPVAFTWSFADRLSLWLVDCGNGYFQTSIPALGMNVWHGGISGVTTGGYRIQRVEVWRFE